MSSPNLKGDDWTQVTNHSTQMTMKDNFSVGDHSSRRFERIRRLRVLERELAALAAFDTVPVVSQDQIEVIELRKEIARLKRELALAANL